MDTGIGWDFIPESGGQTKAGSGLRGSLLKIEIITEKLR